MSSIAEKNILYYLSVAAKSFHKCLNALAFQQKSVLSENIDNLIIQTKEAYIIANNALLYKKTADALVRDMKKEGVPVDSGFSQKVAQYEKELETLSSDYNESYTILKDKIIKLMDKYDKKISEFSKMPNTLKQEAKSSYYHLPEMLDVSV